MTDTISTQYGDLTVWTTADPQNLPAASAAMMTSVANALDSVISTYATAALLLADSPTLAGYYTADDAPGGFFHWSGSAWDALAGVPIVSSTGIITSPATGWKVEVSGLIYRYNGTTWKIDSQPITVFTRTPANLANGTSLIAVDFDTTPLNGTAFTEANGVFTCVIPGTYRIVLSLSFGGNATGNRGVALVSSTGVNRGSFISAATSVMQQTLTVPVVITLAVSDTMTVTARQDSGGSLSTGGEIVFERVA